MEEEEQYSLYDIFTDEDTYDHYKEIAERVAMVLAFVLGFLVLSLLCLLLILLVGSLAWSLFSGKLT